jgi:hypothetical protein
MRFVLSLLPKMLVLPAAFVGCLLPLAAQESVDVTQSTGALRCLSIAEMRHAVSVGEAVPQAIVLRSVKQATPRSDMLTLRLCETPHGLTYVMTALRREGRVVRVTLDARSGEVTSLR